MNKEEEFLNNYTYGPDKKHLEEVTKEGYRKLFKILRKEFQNDDLLELLTIKYDDIVKYIDKTYNNSNHWFQLNKICGYYGIEYKPAIKKQEATKKEKKDLKKIREKIQAIPNTDINAKIMLTLITIPEYSVRRDWSYIMIKENCSVEDLKTCKGLYSLATGEFDFKELNKTKRKIKFKVDEKIQEMIKEYAQNSKKYLFECASDTEQKRNWAFGKYVNTWAKKYLGEKLGINVCRTAISMESQEKTITEGGPNVVETLIRNAQNRDHSLNTEFEYYKTESNNVTESNVTTTGLTREMTIKLFREGKPLKEIIELHIFLKQL